MSGTCDLFSHLTAIDHLLAALDRTARGKRRRPDVSWFLLRREPAVAALARALADGRWRPAGFDLMRLREPKHRVIARAPFVDRVVHTALVDLIAPVFDRSLMPEDFACRPGFGQHRAVLRAQALMRRYGWVCHLDVRAFFPSVDLDVMRALIADRIADERMLGVIDLILADGARIYREPEVRAYAGLGDDWPPPGRGLPIGAATSQYLAVHVYLNGLDHHVKRALKVPGYLRSGDDLAVFGRGRAEVKAWRAAIGEWLWQARGLRLKHPEAPVLRTAGHLDWLGYRITRDGRAPHGRAQRRLLRRLRAELRGAGAVQIERSVASSAGVMLF